MIVHKNPEKVDSNRFFISDGNLSHLASTVAKVQPKLSTAVVIVSSDKKWENWIKNNQLSNFIFFRAHTVHQLLRNPSFLENHLFVFLENSFECSKESLGKLLKARAPVLHEIFWATECITQETIQRFLKTCQNLAVDLKIELVSENFVRASKQNSFENSPKLQNFDKNEFKIFLINELKAKLSESPEKILCEAIKEIKKGKSR